MSRCHRLKFGVPAPSLLNASVASRALATCTADAPTSTPARSSASNASPTTDVATTDTPRSRAARTDSGCASKFVYEAKSAGRAGLPPLSADSNVPTSVLAAGAPAVSRPTRIASTSAAVADVSWRVMIA